MTKALVIGCGDPLLDAEFPKVKSIVRTDEVVSYRFSAPEGMFCEGRAHEADMQLAFIKEFMAATGPFDALAVLGHTDCPDHAVDPEHQRRDIKLAAMQLRDRLKFPQPVHAVLAIRTEVDDSWVLEDWGRY